jgi:hypothetical protein
MIGSLFAITPLIIILMICMCVCVFLYPLLKGWLKVVNFTNVKKSQFASNCDSEVKKN